LSFNGGGTSGTLPHSHNNLTSQGGALDDTTLLNTPTLQNKIFLQAVTY
jgi:hypothetical protein